VVAIREPLPEALGRERDGVRRRDAHEVEAERASAPDDLGLELVSG
jgi:hypothetical protein